MSKLREAAGAVRRRDAQDALVLLWNELEPARLAGDRSTLARIEALAGRIAEEGEEADRRDAERLLEAVGKARESGAEPATQRIDGELSAVGERIEATLGEQAAGEASKGARLEPLMWLLILLAIVVLNVLDRLRD